MHAIPEDGEEKARRQGQLYRIGKWRKRFRAYDKSCCHMCLSSRWLAAACFSRFWGMTMDLEVLEKWCQDGITMLSSPEDIPHLVELRRKLVTHFSRSPKLYELASDISEDLSDLPEDARRIAREYLISTYGFSFEFFVDRKLAKVREILKRGKIRSAAEFRALSDFAADVEVEEGLARDAELLLASYSKA